MLLLSSWLLFPIVAIAICVGLGFLVASACGVRLPRVLSPAVGLAALIVLVSPLYTLGAGAPAPFFVAAVLAGAGFVLERRRLRHGWHVPAVLAGLAAFAVYAAPVVLSGTASFLGYNLLNDTSIHFVLIDYLTDHGAREVALAPSSFASAIHGYLGTAYPLGIHEALATLAWPFGIDIARLYQPFISLMMGITAVAATTLLHLAKVKPAFAAAAGFVSAAAYLPFSYGAQGSIKELAVVLLLMSAAAVSMTLIDRPHYLRGAVPLGIVAAAAFATYSAAALPYIATLFALVWLVLLSRVRTADGATLVNSARRVIPPAFLMLATLAIASVPTLLNIGKFLSTSNTALSSGVEYGNLIGPLPRKEVFGVFLNSDYRLSPPLHDTTTVVLIALAAALAVVGIAYCARKRIVAPFLYAVPALAAYIAVSRTGSPWVDAKLLVIVAPSVPLLAGCGALAIYLYRRVAGIALGCAYLAGVLLSDFYAYRGVFSAPIDRLTEQSQIGRRFEGRGPMLFNEFDEYAKHFARGARPIDPYEGWTPSPAATRRPNLPVYAHYYDLDSLRFDYAGGSPLVALRRSPSTSRPPADYRRAFGGHFYEVWERRGKLAPDAHLPLGLRDQSAAVPNCKDVAGLARRAQRHRQELVGANASLNTVVAASRFPAPDGWSRVGPEQSSLQTTRGARTRTTFRSSGGTYLAWLRGSFGRGVTVNVNGREIGRARDIQGPGQYSLVGRAVFNPGENAVELATTSPNLTPASGYVQRIDSIVFQPVEAPTLIAVPPSAYRRLCRRPLDWIELVPVRLAQRLRS